MSQNGSNPSKNRNLALTVVRHGETDANKRHVLQGQSNYALNEDGRDQATRAGQKLKDDVFDWVFSSDQTRAYQTAELIVTENETFKASNLAADKIIVKEVLLRERTFGVLEGSTVAQLQEEAKKHNTPLRQYTPEGGETPQEVQTRVQTFYTNLFDKVRQEPPSDDATNVRVLVVTHGGWIREMLGIFLDKLGCQFPAELGPKCHQKLTPNTGIARFSIVVKDSGIEDFECLALHQADHLPKKDKVDDNPNYFGDDDKKQ